MGTENEVDFKSPASEKSASYAISLGAECGISGSISVMNASGSKIQVLKSFRQNTPVQNKAI